MINAPELNEIKINPKRLREMLSIDASTSTSISKEMAEHPSHQARFIFLYFVAKKNVNSCKYVLETTYARAFSQFRSDGNAEKTSDQLAKLDEGYQKARKLYMEAESEEQLLRGILEGFRDRKDILVNLSATIRQEMQTSIKIL